MEGVLRAAKRHQRPRFGRHLRDHVLEIVGSAQQAEPPLAGLPIPVEVEEGSHELRGGVGVNAAILLLAAAAHRHHHRAPREIQLELFREGACDLGSANFLDEAREARAGVRCRDRQQARRGDGGEIGDQLLRGARRHEAPHDDVRERLSYERRAVQGIEIEQGHHVGSAVSPTAIARRASARLIHVNSGCGASAQALPLWTDALSGRTLFASRSFETIN